MDTESSRHSDFELELVAESSTCPANGNVDAYVSFADGTRYFATFFTIENIKDLMESYRSTGECLSGTYFWSSDMIIVESVTDSKIRETVGDLIRRGEFRDAFCKVTAQA